MRCALILLYVLAGVILVTGTFDVNCDQDHDSSGSHGDGSSHSMSSGNLGSNSDKSSGNEDSNSSKDSSGKSLGSSSSDYSSKSSNKTNSSNKSDGTHNSGSLNSHSSDSKSGSGSGSGYPSSYTKPDRPEKPNKKYTVRPKCCDLCQLLTDKRSEYYQKCGKYLTMKQLSDNTRMCQKQYNNGDANVIRQLTWTFRKECFQKFASLVDFDCLSNDVSKAPSFNGFCKQKFVKDICGTKDKFCPTPRQCDECRSLLANNSQFNKACGNAMNDDTKELFYWRCSSACDDEERRAVFAQIVGFCHCYEPTIPIDFCKME